MIFQTTKQLGQSVKCECSNRCLRGGGSHGGRAPTCSAATTSQCAGPKIQTARGQRPGAIAIWEFYTHIFIEIEEIGCSNKHSAKAPSGFGSEHLALPRSALQRERFHHYQAALWLSKNPQISIPWTSTPFKKETGNKLAWTLGFITLSQDSHDTRLLTAFPSLVFN